MIHVLKGHFGPLKCFILPIFVFCHLGVGRFIIRAHNVRADYFLDKSTDFAGSYDFMESGIYFFIYGYG